jgi:hypothetical protein
MILLKMGRLLIFNDLVEMKINSRYYGCTVLVILSIIILLFIVSTSEGFIDGLVPDYCGTAGIRLSDGSINWLKSNGTDVSTIRLYTPSECNKLENGVFNSQLSPFMIGGKCYKLKNDMKDASQEQRFADSNIDIDYSDKCAGLNAIPSPAPAECLIDGVHAGKNSTALVERKKITPDNTLRLYTKNECDLLKGEFRSMEEMMKAESPENIAKAVQANGKDYGLCIASQGQNVSTALINFSFACTTNAKPTGTAVMADAAKTALKGWLA